MFVIDNLKVGGAEQVFVDIVKLCEFQLDFDVLLITSYNGYQLQLPKGIKVWHLKRKSKYDVISALKLAIIMRKYKMIHVHMRHTFQYLFVVNIFFILRKKFIFHDHYGKIRVDKSKPFGGFQLIKPHIYIGVCQELCDWAVDVWKINKYNVYCLQNIPNLDLIGCDNSFEIQNNGKFVMVGNIKTIKNQLFALKIANELGVEIDFFGNNQDEQYYKLFKSKILSKNLIENCFDIKNEIGKYKLGIFTSLSESGPLVILEYLLCGIPFLAYKTGGIAEILFKYYPDFFMDNFDENLWKQRIVELLENDVVVDREYVLSIIEKEFSRDTYLKRLKQIYSIV